MHLDISGVAQIETRLCKGYNLTDAALPLNSDEATYLSSSSLAGLKSWSASDMKTSHAAKISIKIYTSLHWRHLRFKNKRNKKIWGRKNTEFSLLSIF